MQRLFFYLAYAARNIRRGGRWTALAIFCIAAGVATVVALRGMGLAIADSLLSDVRDINRGDAVLVRGDARGELGFASLFGDVSDPDDFFTDEEVRRMRAWAVERGATLSAYMVGGNVQVAAVDFESFGRPQFVSPFFIDPEAYPPTYSLTALEPRGVPLHELLNAPTDIVISDNLASEQGIAVGETVRVSGTEMPFTVRGIVDTGEEAGLTNLLAAFFGFVYLDIASAPQIIEGAFGVNHLAIVMPEPVYDLAEARRLADELRDVVRRYGVEVDLAAEVLQRNQIIATLLGDFIVVLGLGALLIGGVGILNTMLVMVRRRTEEIAALKTFGLKGRQIALLFLTEGLLLGLVGSVIGCAVGVLMGGAVNQYGATLLQQDLPWRVYPQALAYGMALGLVTTAVFGVAPILTALQVRPAIILRPNETHIPRLGVLQSLALMLFVTLALGLIVGQVVTPSFAMVNSYTPDDVSFSPYFWGVVGVAGTLLVFALLVMVLWGLVWLIGKLPAFGNVELRLALRNLSARRTRTATTLLALSAGMFALSSITFVGQGTREWLNLQLTRQFGGNVLVFPLAPGALQGVGQFAVANALQDLDGIRHRSRLSVPQADLVAVDGRAIDEPFVGQWENLSVWDSDNPAIYSSTRLSAGRALTLADRGQARLVGPAEASARLGIRVGSTLTYEVEGRPFTFEVVGLTASAQGGTNFLDNFVMAAPDVLPESASEFSLYTYDIADEHLNAALVELSTIRVPPTFALDISFLDRLVGRLIDQFAAIPTVVGGLSLLAAAVIMANTVALATLERRRQIGILKAIGLKRGRVLRIMLIENGLIGLLSAVLGLGLSALFLVLFTALTETVIPLPRDARLAGVALVIVAVLIGWASTFLSANIAVRERVMNVLRYE